MWACLLPWITDPAVFLLSFELLNEKHGGEWGAAGIQSVKGPATCGFMDLSPAALHGFYMFITSGSGGPACLQRRDRRLHVCWQDGRINTWTSRCCFHCQTVCRWRTEEEAERRQHGPTEAGRLRLWVSSVFHNPVSVCFFPFILKALEVLKLCL